MSVRDPEFRVNEVTQAKAPRDGHASARRPQSSADFSLLGGQLYVIPPCGGEVGFEWGSSDLGIGLNIQERGPQTNTNTIGEKFFQTRRTAHFPGFLRSWLPDEPTMRGRAWMGGPQKAFDLLGASKKGGRRSRGVNFLIAVLVK